MSGYPHRLLVVTTAVGKIKSPYLYSAANPTVFFSLWLQCSLDSMCLFSVPRAMNSATKPSLHTCIRFISISGKLANNGCGRFLADDHL